MSDVIRFEDVHRHFGRHAVLRGLTFEVRRGEIYAFLGRNGAGKTTALRILLGLLAPHGGRSEILGVDSTQLQPAHRARIGYVGEGHRLYPAMRVSDAIAFEAETRSTLDRGFVARAVQRCGLRPAQVVARLSRGERAQLSLILAAAGRPDVLVFDDPAMGLDVVMRRSLLDAMIDLLAGFGCTVLFSSHILTDVERIADRVGILHEGTMLVDATLDDLKRRVARWPWQPANGATPPVEARVLRATRRHDGFALTLVDADAALLERLRAHGRLGEPATPDLEELFLDLTGPERNGLLSESLAARAERDEVTP
ncbi:MAG: ABC transporter ATP-binding protein [Planctomycetes bacterium]|nr:ABC transporter ATP-binding protein [Planctomycetota bacterium]